MIRLVRLGMVLLFTLSAAWAQNVVIDPFTTPLPNDSTDSFVTGLGPSTRTIAPSPTGTIEITGTNLAVSSPSGQPLLAVPHEPPVACLGPIPHHLLNA